MEHTYSYTFFLKKKPNSSLMSVSQLALVATVYVLECMSEDSLRPPREFGKNETTFHLAISGR